MDGVSAYAAMFLIPLSATYRAWQVSDELSVPPPGVSLLQIVSPGGFHQEDLLLHAHSLHEILSALRIPTASLTDYHKPLCNIPRPLTEAYQHPRISEHYPPQSAGDGPTQSPGVMRIGDGQTRHQQITPCFTQARTSNHTTGPTANQGPARFVARARHSVLVCFACLLAL